jgi:hypothetical protein
MNDQQWDGIEPVRSHLRVLVARVGAELVRLETSQPGETSRGELQPLTQSWQELVSAYCMRQSSAA